MGGKIVPAEVFNIFEHPFAVFYNRWEESLLASARNRLIFSKPFRDGLC